MSTTTRGRRGRTERLRELTIRINGEPVRLVAADDRGLARTARRTARQMSEREASHAE